MAKEQKQPKVKRINRVQAANRILSEFSGKATLGELAEKANALVVASGGPNNVKDAAWAVRRALETMEAIGVVRITRPTDMHVERLGKK